VEFEVIVADDASTDETVHAEGTIKGVRFLRNESNQGFLESCNRAVATARGEYVLLLNNDTELKPGAIDALLATFDRPSVGLVGAKLIYPDGTLQEAGGIIWNDGTTSNYGRQGDAQDPSYNYRRQVDYCSAAALMVRKSVWDELGGFDSRFRPAYYEDVDLAFRARKAGYEVCYQPLAEVIHFEGITSGKELDHGAKSYQETNAQRFREAWARELSTYPAPGAPAHEDLAVAGLQGDFCAVRQFLLCRTLHARAAKPGDRGDLWLRLRVPG
jgi:GT2 family glycosyltransferase